MWPKKWEKYTGYFQENNLSAVKSVRQLYKYHILTLNKLNDFRGWLNEFIIQINDWVIDNEP